MRFIAGQQHQVACGDLDLLAFTFAAVVDQFEVLRAVTQRAAITATIGAAVDLAWAIERGGEVDRQTILARLQCDRSRGGSSIANRKIEGQAVRQDADGLHQLELLIAERFAVDLQTDESRVVALRQ